MPSYDDRNLAQRGDVVVVSINHRLNAFGFLNLAEFGDRYADSGSAGLLDIIAALEWVRDNIGNFGGDSRNVTIFGQSGGGAKVNFLMATPSARGLFHKAIAQSATPMITHGPWLDFSAKHAVALLLELGMTRSNVDGLRNVPQRTLLDAYFKTFDRLAEQERPSANIGPIADGRIVPQQPFNPTAPAISSHVPMLIGNTLNEGSGSMFNPSRELWTDAQMREELAREHGPRSTTIADALRQTYPNVKPVEIFGHAAPGANGLRYRIATLTQAARKAAQNAAPAYVYTFAWQTTIMDGRLRAFHRSDIAFVFDNTDRCAHLTGGTEEARSMAAKVSLAWIAFTRTGNPNHQGLPNWPAFTEGKVPTMIFDNRCEVKYDHDRDARQAFVQA